MRTAFIETLCALAEEDSRVWLLCGDLGYSVLETFARRFPERYINAGIAEQNMIGVAAGLALSGKMVFAYSIANFPIMRCLEQIRNDVCYHRLNVKIVAVGGGMAYGSAGYSHHAIEDMAVMRVLPYMTVVAPGDPVEARLATRALAAHDGPCYLRIGKAGEPFVHHTDPPFRLGHALIVRDGSDITLMSTGGTLTMACAAAEILAGEHISTRVVSMPTICPLDEEAILEAVKLTRALITIEEHGVGGLGSAVGELLAISGISTKFVPLRLCREPISVAGNQTSLCAAGGLSVESVVDNAKRCL